mmetsp:Transcript_8903/g.29300  ORF Transcript_8903/g.29300 Transcript_8903/m.29300 type:complete len:231 (-) Transcript_8903:769-1461(-)
MSFRQCSKLPRRRPPSRLTPRLSPPRLLAEAEDAMLPSGEALRLPAPLVAPTASSKLWRALVSDTGEAELYPKDAMPSPPPPLSYAMSDSAAPDTTVGSVFILRGGGWPSAPAPPPAFTILAAMLESSCAAAPLQVIALARGSVEDGVAVFLAKSAEAGALLSLNSSLTFSAAASATSASSNSSSSFVSGMRPWSPQTSPIRSTTPLKDSKSPTHNTSSGPTPRSNISSR